MTREEEIEQQALLDENAYVEHNYYAFKRGVEWADKHPKRYNQDELCDIQLEMMRQRDKRLIKKVCEWIKENIDIYAKVVINHKSNYPEIVMCDTFEKKLYKSNGGIIWKCGLQEITIIHYGFLRSILLKRKIYSIQHQI